MQLDIRGVSKTYANGVQALKDASLSIPIGLYGLVGPAGAGKSTLMRILATLQDPDAGSIRLGEIDVLARKDELRRTLGYLPQEFGQHPQVGAQALLDHFALLRGITRHWERRELVEGLLRQVGLWEERKQKLGGLSAGLRQRFALAVALLGNPTLLLADEPMAGLDPGERTRLLALLRALGEHRVVVLCTNRAEEVAAACTRVALIDRGEILLEAEPLRAVEVLEGRTWRGVLERAALSAIERKQAQG